MRFYVLHENLLIVRNKIQFSKNGSTISLNVYIHIRIILCFCCLMIYFSYSYWMNYIFPIRDFFRFIYAQVVITTIHKIFTCYEYLNIGIKNNLLVLLFGDGKILRNTKFLALTTVQNIFSSRVLSNFSAGCFCNSHVRTFMMLRIQNA